MAQRRHGDPDVPPLAHSAPNAPPQTPGTPLLEAARAASRSRWRRMTRIARAGHLNCCANTRVGWASTGASRPRIKRITIIGPKVFSRETTGSCEYSATAISCQGQREALVLPRSSPSSSEHSSTQMPIRRHWAERATSARQMCHSLGKARAPSSQRPRTGQLGLRIDRPSTRRRLTRRRVVRFAS